MKGKKRDEFTYFLWAGSFALLPLIVVHGPNHELVPTEDFFRGIALFLAYTLGIYLPYFAYRRWLRRAV